MIISSEFTIKISANTISHSLDLLVKPNTEFDEAFLAIEAKTNEPLKINGWLYEIEIV